ncbi:hypothetical protein OIU80_02220 [Flavobacterium sp. LS1R47]|uniref:Uncharacterized protein n=1 Tax=Flavobacterium frigoritolerans TaxID=2987686 RepID=A0A9X2ZI00_9FLAO|nr:hypothetical protein [Flavobacterium frigoritolerans]MCV9931085.1 hypothetical protein [Flavobacterium frigoritolerans]
MIKRKYPISKKKKIEPFGMRKEFYKRLLYIALCIIPIVVFGNDKGTFRLVPLPFFLIGMYNLLLIVSFSQLIIDDFFPPKIAFEKVAKPFDKFMYYFSSALFFGSLVFLIFEIRKIDNTINGTQLFWRAGFAGIALAILVTIILKITNPSVYFESKRRYVVHFGLFVGLFLLTAATTSFINHFYASTTKSCKNYTILEKGTSGSRKREHFIHIITENNTKERFSIKKALYEELTQGGKIELCMIKGKLGYDYVTEFNTIKN